MTAPVPAAKGSARASEPPGIRPKIVRVVDRAAQVLDAFTAETGSLTLADLAKRLDLPKPTVFRIATVLTGLGFLEHGSGDGAYALGRAPQRLADALLASLEIRRRARPVMESLRDELNETVVLSLREGDFRYNVDSVQGAQAIGQAQQIGTPIPLYAGAASRAMLSALPDAEVDDYLRRVALRPFSQTTVADPEALRREIVRARRQGYVVSSSEFTPRSHAVAWAIPSPDTSELAALHVSIPPARQSKALDHRAVTALRRAVDAIAEKSSGAS